jgi:glutamyl-tRNA synthetase
MIRVRFAPSPTGYLHIGSARTFIFNWLFARRNQGTMILRIDDTDVERNSQTSLDSIYDGLNWLELTWDEFYRQSDRTALYTEAAWSIFEKGMAYRDFTPAIQAGDDKGGTQGWLFNPGAREVSREESDRRAAASEPFVLRFRVPRDTDREIRFHDLVYGDQSKSCADIEDFALLRSNGLATYHLASCYDDADLTISHIIRGQDHLPNTFKHVLIFEGLGIKPPEFAHLPLLIAPDGAKLSKRKHGPVVSVTTYRDAGFLSQAYVNFLCLLGWNPKDDREKMSIREIVDVFSFEGVNRSNAVVNFSEEDPIDPKALWLNSQHIYALTPEELTARLAPVVAAAGIQIDQAHLLKITPLIQERIKTLNDVLSVADFFFAEELPPYDPAELIPKKGDAAMALKALESARRILETAEFTHDGLDSVLRAEASALRIKTGQMFQPIRVAVCGRMVSPPLFGTLEVLGRKVCLARIGKAIQQLTTRTYNS